MKVIGNLVREMDMELTILYQVPSTRVIGWIISKKVKEFIYSLPRRNMMGIGIMEKEVGMEWMSLLLEKDMKVNGKKTRDMEWVRTIMSMELFMMDNGSMIRNLSVILLQVKLNLHQVNQ